MIPLKDAAASATGWRDLVELPPKQRVIALVLLALLIALGFGLWWAAQPPDVETVAEQVVRSPALVQAIEQAAPAAAIQPGQVITMSCRQTNGGDRISCTILRAEPARP